MPTPRSRVCLVLLIATAGLLAGCEAEVSTGGNDLNTGDAENRIQEQYDKQSDGRKLTEVDCDSTEAKVGNTFTCTATNSVGVHLDIEGTIDKVDQDTDQAHFTTKTVKAVSDGTYFADKLVANLKRRDYSVDSATCPEVLIETGTKATCDLTMTNDSKQTATITLTNEDGDFDFDTSGPLDG